MAYKSPARAFLDPGHPEFASEAMERSRLRRENRMQDFAERTRKERLTLAKIGVVVTLVTLGILYVTAEFVQSGCVLC